MVQFLRCKESTAQFGNQPPILEESALLLIILAFFDELGCLGGPCPSDLIPLLYLVDILAVTFHNRSLLKSRMRSKKHNSSQN